MRTPTWNSETIHKDDKFSYVLSFEEESFVDAKNHFIKECDWSVEAYKAIKDFYWFSAKVTSFMGKVEIHSEYLGCNCYKSKAQVMGDGGKDVLDDILGGYALQMIEECKEESLKLLELS